MKLSPYRWKLLAIVVAVVNKFIASLYQIKVIPFDHFPRLYIYSIEAQILRAKPEGRVFLQYCIQCEAWYYNVIILCMQELI